MTLYRSMRADERGQPVIARKRWALGVRIGGLTPDVEGTEAEGMVWPLGGGLSVALDWHQMEPGFIPRELGGTAPRSYRMFSLAEELVPGGLQLRSDEPPPGHYVLEPKRMMPIDEYEALLGETQGLWEQVAP